MRSSATSTLAMPGKAEIGPRSRQDNAKRAASCGVQAKARKQVDGCGSGRREGGGGGGFAGVVGTATDQLGLQGWSRWRQAEGVRGG